MDQGNSTETPEINSDMYGQLIFNTEARIYKREKTVPSASGIGEAGHPHVETLIHTTHKNKLKVA